MKKQLRWILLLLALGAACLALWLWPRPGGTLAGVYQEMADTGFPSEVIEAIKDSVDCNLYFFDSKVETGTMYLILAGSTAVLIGIYIVMNLLKKH